MGDTRPVLLRPTPDLADAMTKCADLAGVSRQEWMLRHLQDATTRELAPLSEEVHRLPGGTIGLVV